MSEDVKTVADLVGLRLERTEGLEGAAATVGFSILKETLEGVATSGLPEGRARQALDLLAGVLDVPVPRILVGTWRRTEELREYADPALHPPGTAEEVALVRHTVRASWAPELDVLLNGAPVTTLVFEAELALDLEGAILVIRDGRVWTLRTGRCSATGSVSFRGHTLVRKETPEGALPWTLSFPGGLPLFEELGESPDPHRSPDPAHAPPLDG